MHSWRVCSSENLTWASLWEFPRNDALDLQELEHDELSSDGETECRSNSADGEGKGDYEGKGDGEGKGNGEGKGAIVDDFEEESTGMREPDVQRDAEFEAVDQERGEEDAAKTADNQNSIENDSIIHIEWSITHTDCPACCSWAISIRNDLEHLQCWHHRDRINGHN